MDVEKLGSGQQVKKIPFPNFIAGLATMISRVMRGIYTGYGVIIFFILFIIFFFPLLVPVLFKEKFHLVGIFNRWWARLLFILIGIPHKAEYRFKPDRKKQYIFCPNHFSYLDIPTLGLNRHNAIFVGKNAMEKIPVFGYMYRNLHITVDRSKIKSKYYSLLRSREAIDKGKSLVIYPEGGIMTRHPPQMASFKDGAFRLAIEKQIPVVPVTIPYNWIILPDHEFLLRWRFLKVIFHEPIDTTGLTMDDIDDLKEKLNRVINAELKKHNNDEN